MGDSKACADLGTASTTSECVHNVYWEVSNGTAKYTALPTLKVTVNGKLTTVNVPAAITCSLGGSSVPIVVTADAVPFNDIKVSLIVSVADDTKKTPKSEGITPNPGEVVTLKEGADDGLLGFKCAATVKGTELKYKLDGTDKAQFSLANAAVTVTAAKAGTKPTDPGLTLAYKADTSKPASTAMEGACPGTGSSWI